MTVLRPWFLLAGCLAARAANADPQTEASQHFARGVELAKQGEYDRAVTAFETAYRTSPHPSVLYSLAQAYVGLGRPVEAIDMLQRYLSETEDTTDGERRKRARELIAQQQRRVGFLELDVQPDAARVQVDGRDLGAAARSTPLRLATGVHGLAVSAPAHTTRAESFTISPGETARLSVRLEPLAEPRALAQLAVECAIPGVELFASGQSRGRTPFSHPVLVSAGVHSIQFVRPGYVGAASRVELAGGALTTVHCNLDYDPRNRARWGRLDVDMNVDSALVRVDGQRYEGQLLPPGPHALSVERVGFHPWSRTVHVEPRRTSRVLVALEPTRTHVDRARAEERQRLHWSVGLASVGVALLGSGIATYAWNGSRANDWERRRSEMNAGLASGVTPELVRRHAALWQEGGRIERTDAIAVTLGIGGLATLGLSGLLWWTGAKDWAAW